MKCDECGGQIVYCNGEYYCTRCGLVMPVEELQSERFIIRDGEFKCGSRGVGLPGSLAYHDKGLTTKVSGRYKLLQKRAIFTGKELKKIEAHSQLNKVCALLNLPKPVRDTAAILYRKYATVGDGKKPRRSVIIGACVYAACKLHGILKLPADFKKVGIGKQAIKVARRKILKNYQLESRKLLPQAEDYIPLICNRLGRHDLINNAVAVVRSAGDKLIGKSPVSIAAAAVYFAAGSSGEPLTQKNIAEVAGVTEVTIRNLCKILRCSAEVREGDSCRTNEAPATTVGFRE